MDCDATTSLELRGGVHSMFAIAMSILINLAVLISRLTTNTTLH
jgi:hypothetical protein